MSSSVRLPDITLTPSSVPQTKTVRIPAAPEECSYIRETHPGLIPATGPCYDTLTVHLEAAQTAKAAPGVSAQRWRTAHGWTEICGVFCWVWHSKVSTEYAYNGNDRVWQHWVDCSDYGGTGYTVDVKWCGYWNNGGYGSYYMNMGDNFQVSWVYKGSPVHRGYWQRYNVATNGNYWLTGSGR
ncbi:hypothetical protein AB0G73_35895 [Streptomyces sp. NPDC020719]|uniref:hypothetical protein n=1 Tax=unclassified Streptomyces TaxID=2593676 RepID=UPI00340058C3